MRERGGATNNCRSSTGCYASDFGNELFWSLTALKRQARIPLSVAFPQLCAHVSGVEFHHPNLIWWDFCDQMDNLITETGSSKGQLSNLVEVNRH